MTNYCQSFQFRLEDLICCLHNNKLHLAYVIEDLEFSYISFTELHY